MNKELKTLKRQLSGEQIRIFYANNNEFGCVSFDAIASNIHNVIEQALTPPTEEKLCKVLSEYVGKEVKYVFADGNSTIALNYFYYEDDTNYRFKYQYLCSNMSGNICLYDMNYPSNILKIIAEFYDNLERK